MQEETVSTLKEDSNQFLEEMKQDIVGKYAAFQKYQDITAKTFSVFHDICMKNQIPYYMAFGSLLGVIRDGGQIPWDYDIDILVPYSESSRLIDALDRDLPEGYHYDTRLKNKKCRHYGIKLAPEEYNCAILHVDIFWLIGESETEKGQKHHLMIRKLFFKKFLYKYPDTGIQSKTTKVSKAMFYFNRFRFGILPGSIIERKYLDVIATPVEEDGWCATSGREKAILRNAWFGKPIRIVLNNGQEVCVPQDTESILRSMYGDYSQYPPLKQRIHEFEKSLSRLEKFARIKK